MNKFQGKISSLNAEGELTLVKVQVETLKLSTVVIDTPQTSSRLKVGEQVDVLFKETEVLIGLGDDIRISLQNKIPGTVANIESNSLLSKVSVDTQLGIVNSIITTNAVHQLGLEKGSSVIAMIKTNEVMLSF